MKNVFVKHVSTCAALFAAGALVTACTNNPTSPTIAAPIVVVPVVTVSSVEVTSVASSDASYQLTAIARSSDGSSQDVTRSVAWLSSNLQLATVTSTGRCRSRGHGKRRI